MATKSTPKLNIQRNYTVVNKLGVASNVGFYSTELTKTK